MTSTMALAGKGKGVEIAGADPVASRSAEEMVIFLRANPTMDSGQDLKMLAWDKMLQGGEGLVREGWLARMVQMGDTVRQWV